MPERHGNPSPVGERRRIVLDMTDIANHLARDGQVTGIQRLLLNYAQRLRADPSVETIPGWYDRRYGTYTAFPNVADFRDPTELRRLLPRRILRPYRPEKFADRPFRAWCHRTHARLLSANRAAAARIRGGKVPESFRFRDGDIVLLLGCWWDSPELFVLLAPLAAGKAVTPVVLVHDLTPVMPVDGYGGRPEDHPHYRMLRHITKFVGHFLTFSQSTETDLRAFFREIGEEQCKSGRFPLPHEFALREGESIASDIRTLGGSDYVLQMMSHNLPRKNLDRLLRTWLLLSRRLEPGTMPTLVVAGAAERNRLDPEVTVALGPLLRLVRRPNDSELAFLYRHCLFTVFPSTYEGWGLPIGESLWMGKFCVTSNVSSMPEVGGPFCDYFDPLDIDSMAAAIGRPIQDRAYLAGREAAVNRSKLLSWQQSAAMLRDTVIRVVDNGE